MFGGSSTGTGFLAPQKQVSFLFGSSNNNNNNNAGTSFGGSAGSGFLLGGSNTNSTGGFGSKPATTGFGASTTNNSSGNPGGLFGGSNTASGAASSSGGLFGNTANSTSTTGGLFGGLNSNNAGSTGTSLFSSNPSNNAASSNTSTFGKPALGLGMAFGGLGSSSGAQNAPSGDLFGNTQANQASQISQPAQGATGGLFGNNANTASNINDNNSNATGGLFGGQQPNANTGFNTANKTLNMNVGNTGFSNNAQPSFSWSGNQQPNPALAGTLSNLEIKIPTLSKTQQNASNYTPAVADQLMKLKEQWDPNSAWCALKTHLYNKVGDQEIGVLLQQPRPANESPEDWEKAMAQRPSPLHYPVKVTSFTEVAQRIEVQLEHVAKSRIFLNNIYEKLNQLSSQRDLDTTTRIMKARARHTKLSRRLLNLATLLAVLKLKGYPLLPEEEEILKQFQALNAKLSDPNGAVGKLSDLYARLAILKGRSEDLSSQLESSINTMNGGIDNYNLASTKSNGVTEASAQTEKVVDLLTRLLYKQQIGLGYLNDVVQQDLAAVERHVPKN